MELVTVIIPYFKKKKFIRATLNSVINQTYKNLEIFLIYDDPDKSDIDYIQNLVSQDNRVNLIINRITLGAGKSRNKAIKLSKGNYISFIDADDLWNKNKIDLQIKFMKKNNYSFTHTSYSIINEDQKILGWRKAKDFVNTNELLKSCDIGLSSVIIKKNILSNQCFFPNLKTKEDFVLWLRILKNGHKIYSLKKNLTSWTKSKNSLSSSSIQKLKDSFVLYNRYMKFNFVKSVFYTLRLSINFLLKNL